MKHADVHNWMADYLEGDLPLDRRALFDAHLDGCEECAREADELRETIRLLHTLPDPPVPPDLSADVMRRIRAGEGRRTFLQTLEELLAAIFSPRLGLPAAAMVAAAAVLVVTGRLPLLPSGGEAPVTRSSAATELAMASPSGGQAAAEARSGRESLAPLGATAAAPERAGETSRVASGSAVDDRLASAPGRPIVRIQIPVHPAPAPLVQTTPRDMMVASIAPPPRPLTGYTTSQPLTPGPGVTVSTGGDAFGRPRPQVEAFTTTTRATLPPPSSGTDDARDEWLTWAIDSPAAFGRYIAGHSLAEQELWVSRLAQRADERGVLGALIRNLRQSGDAEAVLVGEDFAAARDRFATDVEGR